MYLQGGLGNQLFQLAAGIAVANRLQVDLILDCSRLGNRNGTRREYALAPFKVPEYVKVNWPLSNWETFTNRRAINNLKNVLTRRHFVEKEGGFDAGIEAVAAGCTLDGYFQSILYFDSVRAEVLEMIRTCSISQGEREIIDRLSQQPFTAVHVRRGDYIDPQVAAVHGLVGTEYFISALSYIKRNCPVARTLYFSDSPGMVQEELGLQPGDFAPNDLSEAATLLLMSRATNVIASNSTFSWWAALVSETNQGGTVIVPNPWFANSTPPDLLPGQWLQIAKI